MVSQYRIISIIFCIGWICNYESSPKKKANFDFSWALDILVCE